ncbi:hypothetical protein [Paracoccus sanguinis]|uniref:hypothetical protein n=1 Tax=Paracoccus sanguinis TaxID=1545044 RepID=UPI0012E09354|nr:hypothetical protein [Paracoccus sanguinis]
MLFHSGGQGETVDQGRKVAGVDLLLCRRDLTLKLCDCTGQAAHRLASIRPYRGDEAGLAQDGLHDLGNRDPGIKSTTLDLQIAHLTGHVFTSFWHQLWHQKRHQPQQYKGFQRLLGEMMVL